MAVGDDRFAQWKLRVEHCEKCGTVNEGKGEVKLFSKTGGQIPWSWKASDRVWESAVALCRVCGKKHREDNGIKGHQHQSSGIRRPLGPNQNENVFDWVVREFAALTDAYKTHTGKDAGPAALAKIAEEWPRLKESLTGL